MAADDKSYEYSLNQVPPIGHLVTLSFQHVMLMVVSLVFPILLASQINATAEFSAGLISLSMLAVGLGSILQSVRLPFIGCGYLFPNVVGPSYFSLSLTATWIGGLPLMRGMLMITGLFQMAMSPIIVKLKRVFPSYIVGLVVAMVGISIINPSMTSFFGLSFRGDSIVNVDILIGFFALMVMVLLNLWARGMIKIYCLLVGMLAGWILALILAPDYWHSFASVRNMPLFAIPHIGQEYRGITFDLKMVIPFIVIAVSGGLKSFGNLMAIQKISEPDLKEINYIPIRKGLLTDGFSTFMAGLMGAMAVDSSSSNVGLAGATKVVSRWIGVGAGVIFIILAFFPKLIVILTHIPKPVLGAALVFSASYMICAGLQEMFKEKWEPRKTFVVGIALVFGLSTAFLPSLYARAPHFIQAFFTDPLPTTTIIAVILNQFFNLDNVFEKLTQKLGKGRAQTTR